MPNAPVDGSARASALRGVPPSRGRARRKAWARRPLAERIALVCAGVARLGEMNDEIVPELAHMMGRPVRYGGEFGGVNERATTWPSIAAEALAPIVIETARLRAADRARAAWRRASSSRPGTTPT
jgi:hypothetical protein